MTTGPAALREPGTRAARRPSRGVLLVAALIVLVALTAFLLPRGEMRPLDPESTSSGGARALARVLGERGVGVHAARSTEQLRAAPTGDDVTLLVVGAADLSERDLGAIRDRGASGRLVLITPTDAVLTRLDIPAEVGGQADRLTAGCRSRVTAPEDTITAGSRVYRPENSDITTCFVAKPDTGAPASDGRSPAAYLDVPRTASRPDTVVVGQPHILANAHITRESHAAIALRLLGQDPTLVWFVPTPDAADPPVEDPGPEAPAWIGPVLAVAALTVLMLCLWRGRRLGPLVVEPLPVVVPAGETTRARARLYRRTGDREAVARLLTDAALDDIRGRLRLPAESSAAQVAQAVHRATGDDPDEILDLLTPRPDVSLGDHATRLHRLRRKVRSS